MKSWLNKSIIIWLALVIATGVSAFNYGLDQGERRAANGPLDYTQLTDIYNSLTKRFEGEIDPTKLLEGAKAGLVAGLGDPYTSYLDKEALKALEDGLAGSLEGIGAEVGFRADRLVIVAPIPDTPAAKAGLKPGDQILKINDEDPTGLTLEEAVSKIKGPRGTQVRLTLGRGTREPFEVTITRDLIDVPSVRTEMKTADVGYIQLVRFGGDTADKLGQAIRDLRGRGANKIILDLRNNPGGYLDASIEVASYWVKTGEVVVEERSKDRGNNKHQATGGASLASLKTIVLVNGGSASASEIVAGALQDHKLATLVGEKTFGKGSVQDINSLAGGAALKVTIANWFTPSGRSISKEGIKPDIEVKRTAEDIDANRDPQLDRALELLR